MLATIAIAGPRIMLQDYPKAIQALVPPKTPKEKRLTIYYSIAFIIIFLGYPFIVAHNAATTFNWQFGQTFLFLSLLTQFINLFDLLVIDWLMFCFITPGFVVLKGTEGHPAYKDYYFHFKTFTKGLVISTVIALVVAGLVTVAI